MKMSSIHERTVQATIFVPGGKGGINSLFGFLRLARQNPNLKITYRSSRIASPLWSLLFPFQWLKFLFVSVVNKPDIVHLNFSSNSSSKRCYWLSLICRRRRIPYLVHIHGGPRFLQQKSTLLYSRNRTLSLFSNAAGVVILGKHLISGLISFFDVDSAKIMILPNAVKMPSCESNTSTNSEVIIVSAGKLMPPKRPDLLIKAISLIRDSRYKLYLPGDGGKDKYKQLAKELGVEDQVFFPGWLHTPELEKLLAKSNMVALVSDSENQPLSIIQGLSFGKPVIVTPVGTCPEFIDERLGIIVPVDDVEATKNAILQIAQNYEYWQSRRDFIKAYFEENFSIDNYADKLYEIYKRVLSNRV